MTPFARLCHHLLERFAGRWHEGPSTPQRLLDLPDGSLGFYPNATRDEWREFARRAIDNAYRAGFARGYEADLRQGFGRRYPSPDYLADVEEPDWRDGPPISFR